MSNQIPELSFKEIEKGDSYSINLLKAALSDHGFFSITEHGLSKELVDNCYESSKKDLDQKYKIIEKNLNRYSKDFLKKINLKYIVLCEDLSISGINTAGIPDNIMKTLIVDIKFNEKFFERVLHHEVFHIINDSYKSIFDEKIWSNFNPKEFVIR